MAVHRVPPEPLVNDRHRRRYRQRLQHAAAIVEQVHPRRRTLGGAPAAVDGVRLHLHRGGVSRWRQRSEEHTSELQSLMRISYAVFCLKKKINSIPRAGQQHMTSSIYILS